MNKVAFRFLLILIGLCTFSSLSAQNIGDQLQIRWKLLDNNYENKKHSLTELTILNQSQFAIPEDGWSVLFSSMRLIDVTSVKGDFSLKHVNGDLYELSPTANFAGLAVNDALKISLVVGSRIPNFTDAPGGFYLYSDLVEPSIQAIPDFDILPYIPPADGRKAFLANLYDKNEKVKTKTQIGINIVPSPKKLVVTGKTFFLSSSTKILGSSDFSGEIEFLTEEFKKNITKTLGAADSKSLRTSIRFEKLASLGSEAYELLITENEIIIKASKNEGAFYAVQSLLALMPLSYFDGDQSIVKISTVSIADEPRLGYRGLMMDLARNFHYKSEIFNVINLMANYKLNTLHLHLNDDEGWRIEIPSLPELTEVGSKRSAHYKDGASLPPSYSSGATAKDNQFLTKADFIEILQYAKKHHITVIPEIETPGHARAAIIAMEYKVKHGNGKRIHDPNDKSVYSSAQYWTDNVMDVGLSSTFQFMETVIDDVLAMYKEAGLELKMIHLGGDELPTGAWQESPSIHLLMKDENITSVNRVWSYYVKRILEIAHKRNLQLAGWEELGMINDGSGMKPNPEFANKNILLDVWNNVVGGGQEDLAYRLANMGYPVVYISAHNFYFDMTWNDTYNEPGHNWAAYIDLERSYSFMVHNFLRTLPDDIATKRQGLTAEGKKNIKGIKGALWSEKIMDASRLEYMLLPRVFALAEKAWAPEAAWETSSEENWKALYEQDWSTFANTVGLQEIPRLEKRWKDVNYRIPGIGIKEVNGEVACNLELPGFYIVYTTDGAEPAANGNRYTQPLSEKGVLKFKVFNSSGKGSYTTVYQHN